MSEETRNEVVRLSLSGTSIRKISSLLGISRNRVRRILKKNEERRSSGVTPAELIPKRRWKNCILDAHEETMCDLLKLYPNITAVRLHEELCSDGFKGSYGTVKKRLGELRPRPNKQPVQRYETAPGQQGQVDYSPYDIDFTEEGCRRVHAFSYVLGHSRYQYLRFVENENFTTTIRQHVLAFDAIGGVASTCLYDQMKTVVTRVVDDVPVLNTRFLAFATHYGFHPWICRARRPQTKGKVERPFLYIEKNLLNGRTFRSLEHLNEVCDWWLRERAHVRIHRETKRRPIDMLAEERPHLLPLPEQPYDTSKVVYRTVNAEGKVWMDGNTYSVPWQRIGQLVAVRVTCDELIVYSSMGIREIARHRLPAPCESRQTIVDKRHLPEHENANRYEALHDRFGEMGDEGTRFLEGLVQAMRYGKSEACRVLALLASYRKTDVQAALKRAVRYKAYSFNSVERILVVNASPRPVMETLVDEDKGQIEDLADHDGLVPPRSASEYQDLVDEEAEDEPAEGF